MNPREELQLFKALARSMHTVLPSYGVTRGAHVRVIDPRSADLTPPARTFAHTVQMQGDIKARIECRIDRPLGVKLTEEMAGRDAHDSPECDAAMAELVNIIAGRAAGVLAERGIDVETKAPQRFVTALQGKAALLVGTPLGALVFSVSSVS